MTWFIDHQRLWRSVALLLLFLALVGPWAFEQINVPMPYQCDPPYIRLDDDLCGLPISLVAILVMVVSILPEFVGVVARGEGIPNLFILALGLFLAPIVTSLILIGRGGGHRLQVVHIVFLVLAALAGILFALIATPRPNPATWSLWLYIGVAIGMLAGETIASRAGKVPDIAGVAS